VYREYEYWIIQKKDPFLTDGAWHQHGRFDLDAMNEAAALLLGKQDFECFSKVQTQVNNFICEVTVAEWRWADDRLIFTIRANRFLRNMVRAIVGTLAGVGRGKISLADVKKILESRNRSEAGASVPAHGLYLTKIVYP
jgi:tRNA pseudouridine38-40 synthase